jgi:hypothetical protein
MTTRYGSAAESSVEERGVYWANYRRHGCPVLIAVDSRGERVKAVYVLPTSDPDEAIAFLWRYLDEHDPLPKLELVRDPYEPFDGPPPKRIDAAQLEAIYRDAHPVSAWRSYNAKRLAKGIVPRDDIKRDLRPRRPH